MAPPLRQRRPALALLALCLPAAAVAAPVDLSANAGIVSDYRFRGISLSNRRPAAQGGIDLGFAGGWYAGTWASTIARYGGARVEVDLSGGRTGRVGDFGYGIGAAAYFYPRGERVNYGETRIELNRAFGPATLAVEADYAPRQHRDGVANLYLGARAVIVLPRTPVSLTLRGGHEDGFYAHKLDWEAGVAVHGDRLSASLAVMGSTAAASTRSGRLGRTGLQLALAASF